MVLVHGLGGSHLNWCLLAPKLVDQVRVLAVDLAGFGLTHPAGRSTTVRANAALLDDFLYDTAGSPAILVGNSMGGMISTLQAAEHPETVSGLVLIDPALPIVGSGRLDLLVTTMFSLYAVPGIGERHMAWRRRGRSPRQIVRRLLTLCCADPSALPEEIVTALVALAEQRATIPGLDAAFLSAARSLLLLNANRRAYWSAMRAITAPVLLMHGERDRLVPVRAARKAASRNPSWRFESLPGIGHVPHLEAPDLVADLLLDWLASAHGKT
jgi:pimeloyl-ACP methyl ester carboxylesterase